MQFHNDSENISKDFIFLWWPDFNFGLFKLWKKIVDCLAVIKPNEDASFSYSNSKICLFHYEYLDP